MEPANHSGMQTWRVRRVRVKPCVPQSNNEGWCQRRAKNGVVRGVTYKTQRCGRQRTAARACAQQMFVVQVNAKAEGRYVVRCTNRCRRVVVRNPATATTRKVESTNPPAVAVLYPLVHVRQ